MLNCIMWPKIWDNCCRTVTAPKGEGASWCDGKGVQQELRKPEPVSEVRDDATSSEFSVADSKHSTWHLYVRKGINQFFNFQCCASSLSILTPTSDYSPLTTGFGGTASPCSAPSRIQLCCRGQGLCHAHKQEHCLQPPPPVCFFIYVFICPLQLPPRAFPCSCLHEAISGVEELGLPCPQWDVFTACWPVAPVTSGLRSRNDPWEGSEEVRCGNAMFSASNNSNSSGILFSMPNHGWKKFLCDV